MSKTGMYRVVEGGETNWVEIESTSPAKAGEEWVAERWRAESDEGSYELDVVAPNGQLFAVTVDVDVSVSFSGFATKHPAGATLEKANGKP